MRILINKRSLLVAAGAGLAALLIMACSSQPPLNTATTGPAAVQEALAAEEQTTRPTTPETLAVEEQTTGPTTPETLAAPAIINVEREETAETTFPVEDAAVTNEIDAKPVRAGQVSDAYAETGIQASGRGRATAPPDLASLNLGVEAFASTVSEARSSAATAMTAVMAAVKEDGVEEKDIQTGRFNIRPRYTGREITRCVDVESESSDNVPSEGSSTGTKPGIAQPMAQDCYQEYQRIITGYEVSNSVTVLVRDLTTVDDVIDGAVEAGGDLIRFNGIAFTLEDMSQLQDQARIAAVADLDNRASQLAELSEVSLGNLIYLSELDYAAPRVFKAEAAAALVAYDSGGPSTPISAGEVAVEVSVQGKFAIEPLESETAGN
jgi:uncharacterized protein YggE